jgi:hypothetical protein
MGGQVSQIAYRYIDLKELVKQSALILVVSRTEPDSSEEIPIDATGKHPPYRRYKNHFHVLEVLRNGTELKIDKGPISVLGANDDDQYFIHQSYYLQGVSESPIYDAYKPKNAADATGDLLIIFLNTRPDGQLQFSVESAIESIEEKPRILKLLAP